MRNGRSRQRPCDPDVGQAEYETCLERKRLKRQGIVVPEYEDADEDQRDENEE